MSDLYKQTAQRIRNLDSSFSMKLLQKQFDLQPEMKQKYSERQIKLHLEDTNYHMQYLSESISAQEKILFNEYLGWAKTFFANLPVTDEEILLNLKLIKDEFTQLLPPEMNAITSAYIDGGMNHYKSQPAVPPSFIENDNPHMEIAHEYLKFLIEADKKSAYDLIMSTVNTGVSIKDIYLKIFEVTQKETGRLWQMSKITVAQEHFITAATQMIMAHLYPYLFSSSNKENGIVVSCINGELHEIGARMVADLFEMEGWNSYYFGANTPQRSLVDAINLYKPKVVAISATMTFNISAVSELIQTIKKNSDTNGTKILVGGYPFILAENLWQKIGADGYAENAQHAISLASKLIN